MKLTLTEEEAEFRRSLATFLSEYAPPEAIAWTYDYAAAEGDDIVPQWLREWQATLFDHGWMVPGYPPELGGRNATPEQTLMYIEEMAGRRIPRSGHFPGYAIVGPSLIEFGTTEQKAMAPAAIRGDTIWCIGMSEPDAGSDLASLNTRAERVGDRFVVNGQKVWTSYATIADRCLCYVRTDPDAPKHAGISALIVEMDRPGIEVRPLRQIHGNAEFAEVFFEDVEVPVENLLGELNHGWQITQGSLAHERAGLWVEGVARLEHSVASLMALARRRGVDHDPIVRRRIGEAYENAASLRALGYKGFASFAQGSGAPEHSYMKMATSEAGLGIYELGMEIAGPMGASTDSILAEDAGRWVKGFFVGFAGTIAGGTSEIQRNIIARRVLGLPGS